MKKLQKAVAVFLAERGWDDRANPSSYAKSIMIEAAELLEHFQWKDIPVSDLKKNPKKYKEVVHELADVFIYCLDLASILDLDAEAIIEEKMLLNAKKYPVKLVKGRPKNYLRLKALHRAKTRKSRLAAPK